MKKWLALALFLVFAYSLGAESVEGPCANETTCCACLCQAPSARPTSIQINQVAQIAHYLDTAGVLAVRQLFDKSFFHPPEAPPHYGRRAPAVWRSLA